MKHLRFRHVIGLMLAVISSTTLLANSYLLGSGAVRWASESDTYQVMALAAGGAAVPWLLAVFPMVFKPMLAEAGFFGRLAMRGLLMGMWVVFFAYNFVMGSSNIAKLREDKVADLHHQADTSQAKKEHRGDLKKQLDGIPQHRPAAAVDKLLEAERINKRWVSSGGCTDATAKASRDYCDAYHKLEAEHDYAIQADKLSPQIAELDGQLETASVTTADNADPWVDAASKETGVEGKSIRVMLAMATPVVLEIMGASCLKFAVVLLGLKLKVDEEQPVPEPRIARDSLGNQWAIPSPERANSAPVVPIAMLTRQHELCKWFWRECARPIAAGSLPEREWFDQYAEVCRRSKDTPLPLESFRRIAGRQHGIIIQSIDGETTYQGYLPSIPNEEAVA